MLVERVQIGGQERLLHELPGLVARLEPTGLTICASKMVQRQPLIGLAIVAVEIVLLALGMVTPSMLGAALAWIVVGSLVWRLTKREETVLRHTWLFDAAEFLLVAEDYKWKSAVMRGLVGAAVAGPVGAAVGLATSGKGPPRLVIRDSEAVAIVKVTDAREMDSLRMKTKLSNG
jgi:hypothetical protein